MQYSRYVFPVMHMHKDAMPTYKENIKKHTHKKKQKSTQ